MNAKRKICRMLDRLTPYQRVVFHGCVGLRPDSARSILRYSSFIAEHLPFHQVAEACAEIIRYRASKAPNLWVIWRDDQR